VDVSELSPQVRREIQQQIDIISRGAVELLPEEELRAKLAGHLNGTRGPLRIKQGFDPTSPDIHLGHTVGIRKLKQFQDLGHQVVLIVGDYTAMVGDPSGRSSTRPQLTYEEILRNAETYQDQFFRILDRSKTEVLFNGEWLKRLEFLEVMKLASRYTVARLLERDDFSNRFKNGTPIALHELFYPLMQGYDSFAMKADVELGATEQTFNLLAGRVIQEAYGMEPQCILTLPILVGLDGEKKMSKSLGNYIGVDESPKDMFGKTMSIPDRLIFDYFQLATEVTIEKLEDVRKRLASPDVNPMLLKKELGETIVDLYHPKGSGQAAREEFERVFSQKQLPDDMPELTAQGLTELGLDPKAVYLVHLMAKANMSKSNSEARKLIESGSVSIDGEKITNVDLEFPLDHDLVLKVGKRRFLRLRP
jgi:tyrosyl-tRNA synthetase